MHLIPFSAIYLFNHLYYVQCVILVLSLMSSKLLMWTKSCQHLKTHDHQLILLQWNYIVAVLFFSSIIITYHYILLLLLVKRKYLLYCSVLEQILRGLWLNKVCCLNIMLCRGWAVLFFMFINLFSFFFYTTSSRSVPSTQIQPSLSVRSVSKFCQILLFSFKNAYIWMHVM